MNLINTWKASGPAGKGTNDVKTCNLPKTVAVGLNGLIALCWQCEMGMSPELKFNVVLAYHFIMIRGDFLMTSLLL